MKIKQKIVLQVDMHCVKAKTKAMKLAAGTEGVLSLAIDGPDRNKLVMVGVGINIDTLTVSLNKKVGRTNIISVKELKPEDDKKKKKEAKKKNHEKEAMKKMDPREYCNYPPPAVIAEEEKEGEESDKPAQWVVTMNLMFENGFANDSGKNWTIYRVPTNLLKIQKKAFVPKIISIGPFHHIDPKLKVMDKHKERYLFRLLSGKFPKSLSVEHQEEKVSSSSSSSSSRRGGEIEQVVDEALPRNVKLEDLQNAMRGLEQKTRVRYSDDITMPPRKFVEMMVLDGCFVVELLRLFHRSLTEKIDDPIFTTRWMLPTLQRDLLMLENQLPFFVLEELYKLTKRDEQEPSLIKLILEFLNPLVPGRKLETDLVDIPEHILDVLLLSFISPMQEKVSEADWAYMSKNNKSSHVSRAQDTQLIHCATELQEAGVQFKRNENLELLDIKFSNGRLEIPPLYINDNTVPIFLNFLAYEQCKKEKEPFFTNFFTFYDGLINSSKDVNILHHCDIINHALGNEEKVAKLFNKVRREIVCDVDRCYLSRPMVQVNEYWKAYYATKWHVWRTNLIHDYFSSPWRAISLGAAMLLLILSALQTVYTVVTYYHTLR